jgi:hypothetical protein
MAPLSPSPSVHFDTIAAAFRVEDIADPLVTSAAPDWTVLDAIAEIGADAGDYDYPDNFFCLVRSDSQILGYVALDNIFDTPDEKFDGPADGPVGEHSLRISPDQIVSSDLSLIDLLPLFTQHYFFFVLSGNDLSHTVSFLDIDRLPVKLCLFTLVIGLEAELIQVFAREPSRIGHYLELLPALRRRKATELAKQKVWKSGRSPNTDASTPSAYDVLLATDFIDKFTMVLRSPELVSQMPFPSKRQAESFFNRLQELRNAIAHSASIRAILPSPEDLSAFLTRLRQTMSAVEALASEAE